MTPVDQEFLHTESVEGDCLRAATASLLGLPIAEVPHFVAKYPDPDSGEWYMAWEDWLEARGWELFMIPVTPERGQIFQGYYLAAGKTVRGTHHIVVMQNGKMAHDPHPSRAGLVTISEVYALVPLDAGRMRAL